MLSGLQEEGGRGDPAGAGGRAGRWAGWTPSSTLQPGFLSTWHLEPCLRGAAGPFPFQSWAPVVRECPESGWPSVHTAWHILAWAGPCILLWAHHPEPDSPTRLLLVGGPGSGTTETVTHGGIQPSTYGPAARGALLLIFLLSEKGTFILLPGDSARAGKGCFCFFTQSTAAYYVRGPFPPQSPRCYLSHPLCWPLRFGVLHGFMRAPPFL